MLKRTFDIILSSLFLMLFSWLFILVAFAIKIDDPNGAVMFRQNRVGRFGKKFTLLKFRSMTSQPINDKEFEAGSSHRVTPIGSLLRKTKLDELPQLFNVLRGDMSIVGPRPEVEYWTTIYRESWAIVHNVRPGITDNASILFRNEEELLRKAEDPEVFYRDVILPQKLKHYILYVEGMGMFQDIQILLKTIYAVLFK